MRVRPVAVFRLLVGIVAALAVSAVVGGCAFFPPADPGFLSGAATFATGHATMTIDGERIVLDQLAPGPHFMTDIGPEIYWFNDEGWGLRLMGGGSGLFMPASISIDRVRTTYWSAQDFGGSCQVKLAEADKEGVKGSATCRAMRWSDMLRGGFAGEGFVEGQAPFDATIEFEAVPAIPGA